MNKIRLKIPETETTQFRKAKKKDLQQTKRSYLDINKIGIEIKSIKGIKGKGTEGRFICPTMIK